jgi:hypothetical protein
LVLDWARFRFFDHLHLWFHKGAPEPSAPSSDENVVVLSDAFY